MNNIFDVNNNLVRDDLDPWSLYRQLDKYTFRHCENVAEYAKILAQLAVDMRLYDEITEDQIVHIKNGVIYHDIGKIYLNQGLLNNRNELTFQERQEIRRHVEYGLEIFTDILRTSNTNQSTQIFLDVVLRSIAQHHERFDGNGYPNKLKGYEISVVGRICALCDYYDALTSDRPYRMSLSHEYVMLKIKNESGAMFDPLLVDLMIDHQFVFKNKLAELRHLN
ncbi:HD domain-containing phosphohydrolase [Anaerotignum sp.]|uniref:HD-GYP domain-containing protein n=1 Tax=Anaerotignum sp. TaxID=2039241 RepID=UPI0033319612